MKRIGIIMAGGAGERFWPLSRKKFPKQLLPLGTNNNSILEDSINRAATVIPYEDIFVITNELLVNTMRNTLKMLPKENIIPEPAKRNTAPCLTLAIAYILARYNNLSSKDISIAILTADQNIYPIEKFTLTLDAALSYAENNNSLVTIGIIPTRPETGYGYIETAEQCSSDSTALQFNKVLQFREKPNKETAEQFIKTGRFTWNSGMFFWRCDTFINNLIKYMPELGNKIENLKELLLNKTKIISDSLDQPVKNIFNEFPSISIDYALMEKADNVVVCKAIFNWDDIGSWDSLYRTKKADENGNITNGKTSIIDSSNSIVMNYCSQNLVVAGINLKDLVVVATDDAILVCPKSEVQNIKKTVEDIKNNFGEEHI
ncbi:MAG: mannose-1-phosphate guanylyltransferase [Bacteroidetes bacterium]|nr:mannose-1-phosphate guanylyltransferase [Bacteroidota bacterium]